LEIIKLDTYRDFRGEIWTVYSKEHTDVKFVADKITISSFGVLRGFHGDANTAKYVTCLGGQMQFAVADARLGSKTYGNCESFYISDNDPTVVYVPAGCVNAHLALSDRCVFYYKWSEEYTGPDNQVTVSWDDPSLKVGWAVENPILSDRDKNGSRLQDIKIGC